MLYIDSDNSIHLTRGDTARLMIDRAKNVATGEDYVFTEEDTVEMSVKKTVNDTEKLIYKKVSGGSVFHFEPEDTKSLSFGRYVYDIQLTTNVGDIYTVITPTVFEVMKEVT